MIFNYLKFLASTIGCPSCEKGNCDFINRDQCFMCKFDLHDGQLPHVHCLKENVSKERMNITPILIQINKIFLFIRLSWGMKKCHIKLGFLFFLKEHCDPTHHNTLCCSDEQCIGNIHIILYSFNIKMKPKKNLFWMNSFQNYGNNCITCKYICLIGHLVDAQYLRFRDVWYS